MTITRWWLAERTPKALRRSESCCFSSTATSGGAATSHRGEVSSSARVSPQRHLAATPAGAAKLVDARVLGDPVDPRLEGDRNLAAAQASQRRDEDLLGHVVGPCAVAESAKDLGADPGAVAAVELLERRGATPPDRGNQLLVGMRSGEWRHALAGVVSGKADPTPLNLIVHLRSCPGWVRIG